MRARSVLGPALLLAARRALSFEHFVPPATPYVRPMAPPEVRPVLRPPPMAAMMADAEAWAAAVPATEVREEADPLPMELCNGMRLEEATIDEMQSAMRKGDITSEQLVDCYIKRTLATKDYANSLIEFNPDARGIAQDRDHERRNGTLCGPLHGIPFTVKDNIASADTMQTTAGSWALLGSVVPADAFVVQRLRKAGAVLLGKAAMSEWADMRSTNYSEGYSARGGQCRSAYNLTVNPGGSSSGSAVGVAINAVAFSIGTETDGSVINPAMRNSIVGIKPTVGLTSRAGVIPESENQDSVGTFGRTVRDAVYALNAIYGPDPKDPATLKQCDHKHKMPRTKQQYTEFLATKEALNDTSLNPTFGIPWNSFWVHADAESRGVLLEMVELIRKAGATIVHGTEIANYEEIVSPHGWDWDYGSSKGWANRSEYTYIKVDFMRNIEAYLKGLKKTNVHTLREIVEYNKENWGSEGGFPGRHPAFFSGQDGLLASLATNGTQDKTYWDALHYCQSMTRGGIDSALRHQGRNISALLVPLEPGQSFQIAAQAGYPLITIPAGIHKESGMGFGLGLMQSAWGERELIRWASAIEDLMKKHSYKRSLPKWRGLYSRNIPVPL